MIVIAAVAMTLVGCGGSVANVNIDVMPRRPSKAQPILIKRFDMSATTAEGDFMDDPAQAHNHKQLIADTIKYLLLQFFRNEGYSVAEYAPGAAGLVIDGQVMNFSTGSRQKRLWLGFGAGHAWVQARSLVYDAADPSRVLVDIIVEGSSGSSTSLRDMTAGNCRQIAAGIFDYLVFKPE